MKGHERCRARHRRWLLAAALLAGGTGIALGSVLAALLAGTGISPLVWVSAVGRLVATIGIVFAWSSLDTRPTVVRLLRARAERLLTARRTTRFEPPSRTGRSPAAPLRDRVRSLVAPVRSILASIRSYWPACRRTGWYRTSPGRPGTTRRPEGGTRWLSVDLDGFDGLDPRARLARLTRVASRASLPGTVSTSGTAPLSEGASSRGACPARARSAPRFRSRTRSRSRSRSQSRSRRTPLSSSSSSATLRSRLGPGSTSRARLSARVGTLLSRAPVV